MASVFDALNETFADHLSVLKFAIYGIPVYFAAQFYLKGQMGSFYTLLTLTVILLLGMMTCVINNVRENRQEVITLNPLQLGWVTAKTAVVMTPVALVCWGLITLMNQVLLPLFEAIPIIGVIIKYFLWGLLGSLAFTSYLSYAKFLQIKQAYNISVISDSCIDILCNLIFFIPQIVIVNLLLLSVPFYVFYFFHFPFDHWFFVAYCSMLVVANVSIIGNYYAQAAFEIIKGRDSDYDNKHNISSLLDVDDTEKANV